MGSIQSRKAAMGYMTATRRPSCRNCAYSSQDSKLGGTTDVYPWHCDKGGFGTTAQAVCEDHQPSRLQKEGGAA